MRKMTDRGGRVIVCFIIEDERNRYDIYATAHHEETVKEAYREGLIDNDALLPLTAFQ